MKQCPNCNHTMNDDEMFCTECGARYEFRPNAPQQPVQQQVQSPVQPTVIYVEKPNLYDHTAEFDPKDVSDNKIFAMLIYLMGVVGVIIALMVSSSSPYVAFHVRQSLKITVITMLGALASLVLCWTIIIPIAFTVLTVALFVVRIICFVQICEGKAVEPAIVRSLKFLK